MAVKGTVHVVDDDASVRRGLGRLIKAHGYDTHVFASAREFLAKGLPSDNSCLIVDVLMPDMGGLQLQEELTRLGCSAPVIFVTALHDPHIQERAKLVGAVGFYQKPVDGDALLDAVKWALTGDPKPELGMRKLKRPKPCCARRSVFAEAGACRRAGTGNEEKPD